jgi:hypothetical protein
MSAINQRSCWEAGATPGRKKSPRRIKTLTPWTTTPTKLLHARWHWEERRATRLPHTGSKPAWETFGRPTGEQQASPSIPTAMLGINQHSPWTDWPPHPTEQNKKNLNNKQGTEKEYAAEGTSCTELTGEGGRSKKLISMWTFSKQKLERQKGWQQAGDKLLPEIGQVVVHKAHLLRQWARYKVKQCCKLEKQSSNHHNMLMAGRQLTDFWPCPRERGQGKETSPQ